MIVGDFCTATLNELITFRKLSQISWTENQFEIICSQLIKGLMELHKNGIAHRDIRPHNICYSNSKKSFILGGLHNSITVSKNRNNNSQIGYNLSGVPYYLPKGLMQIGRRDDYS